MLPLRMFIIHYKLGGGFEFQKRHQHKIIKNRLSRCNCCILGTTVYKYRKEYVNCII